jgi:hypothetical protein
MKTKLLVLLIIFFFTSGTFAQLLFEENFNYSNGSLTGNSGGNWSAIANSTFNVIQVSGTGLTYSGYSNSGIGKKITIIATTAAAEDVARTFTSQSSGKIFASFLVNITNTTDLGSNLSNGNFFAAFLESTSTNQNISKAGVVIREGSVAGSTVNFGIFCLVGQFSSTQWINANFAVGTTHLIVFSYEIVSGANNDIASLWVNPSLSGTPAADVTQTANNTEPSNIAKIIFRQATTSSLETPNAEISGIRVSTDWSQAPLPVELTSFTALAISNKIELNWQTATEINNYGFEIERSENRSQKSEGNNTEQVWETIGFVEGNGNSNSPKEYSFTDASAMLSTSSSSSFGASKLIYRLKQIDTDGKYEYSNEIEVDFDGLPSQFSLEQNYPNPFNPSTKIKYVIPVVETGHAPSLRVALKIFDALGNEVATLVNEVKEPGFYEIDWNANGLSSGVYYYRLTASGGAGSFTQSKKLMLIK